MDFVGGFGEIAATGRFGLERASRKLGVVAVKEPWLYVWVQSAGVTSKNSCTP